MMIWLALSVCIAAFVGAAWMVTRQMRELARRSEDGMERKLQVLRQEWGGTLLKTQQLLGERLEGNARAMSEVHRQLGALEGRSREMLEVGKNIGTLQELLRAPKARGIVGELLLGQLLAEQMPREYFEEQHTFKNGERVDAVIKLGGRLVPVDAKFPLESCQRQLKAATDEERSRCRKEFEQAVRKHIAVIAQKYICPDEGTYEFALMYIPAEQVYYETIVRREEASAAEGLLDYALKQRVIPVSPNTFFAYLQVILFGLRGLSVEREAAAIMQQLAQLRGDYARLMELFSVLGTHVKNTAQTFERTDRALERFGNRLVSVDQPPACAATQSGAAGRQPETVTLHTEMSR